MKIAIVIDICSAIKIPINLLKNSYYAKTRIYTLCSIAGPHLL